MKATGHVLLGEALDGAGSRIFGGLLELHFFGLRRGFPKRVGWTDLVIHPSSGLTPFDADGLQIDS